MNIVRKKKKISSNKKKNLKKKTENQIAEELMSSSIHESVNTIVEECLNKVVQESINPTKNIEPFKLDSKNECMKLIKESIEIYIKENNINYDNYQSHYKKWLEIFSKDDYLNEYENQESGIFYNTIYHEIWNSFFEYQDFIIV